MSIQKSFQAKLKEQLTRNREATPYPRELKLNNSLQNLNGTVNLASRMERQIGRTTSKTPSKWKLLSDFYAERSNNTQQSSPNTLPRNSNSKHFTQYIHS